MYYQTIDFSEYTSIGIGGVYKVKVIESLDEYQKEYIIGAGNNILIPPTSSTPLAILGENFNYIHQEKFLLTIGASTPTGDIIRFCRKNDLRGLEFLAKLPGMIGGVVKMNGGLKEWEIFSHIHSLTIDGQKCLKSDIEYSYRHTNINGVITEVVLEVSSGFDKEQVKFFNTLRNNQPKNKSAGSCFKNPPSESAGRLIEAVGLKGFTQGDMAFSEVHANFLVNMGNGSYEDAIYLIELAQKRVKEEFGIALELEIVVLP